jgi:hypothetical protein
MSTVFNPPSDDTPAQPLLVVTNDGFFPDIDVTSLQAAVRIVSQVTPARIREAVLAAMIAVNPELEAKRVEWIAAGHDNLAAVPAPQLGGESKLAVLYRRAIYATVKADIDEHYRDLDSAAAGRDRAEALEPTIDDHRRNAAWAISDLVGRRRTTVELI